MAEPFCRTPSPCGFRVRSSGSVRAPWWWEAGDIAKGLHRHQLNVIGVELHDVSLPLAASNVAAHRRALRRSQAVPFRTEFRRSSKRRGCIRAVPAPSFKDESNAQILAARPWRTDWLPWDPKP